MSKIVISYRRSDTAAVARLLYDRLCVHYRPKYGDEAVYMDVMQVRRGKDYHLQFNQAVRQCGVMLAIIGPNWFGGSKPGHTKITDPDDPVRLELETATRLGVQILPVLVDGAEMLKANRFPRDLRYLTRVDAPNVDSGRDFDFHVQHLISDIDALLNESHRPMTDRASGNANESQVPPAGPMPLPRLAPEALSHGGEAPRTTATGGWRIGRQIHSLLEGHFRAAAVGAFICLLVLGGAGGWFFLPKPPAFSPVSTTSIIVAGPPAKSESHPTGGVAPGTPITIKPLTKDAKQLRSMDFSPDGRMLAVAGDDGFVRLWNAETFRLEQQIPLRKARHSLIAPSVHKIAYSAQGDLIYSVGLDRNIQMINPAMPNSIAVLEPEVNSTATLFSAVAAFPQKDAVKWVAAGGDDGCFRIWRVTQQNTPIVSKFVSGSEERFNKLCQQPVKLEQGREIQTIAYSPNSISAYAAGSRDGSIFLFSPQREGHKIDAHEGPVWQIAFSPDGERLASAGADAKIKIWSVADRKLLRTLDKHVHAVSSIAWSRDGGQLVSGGGDATVRLWDAAAGTQIGEPFEGHRRDVQAVAFHPRRKWIVSASEDAMLKVWELNSRKSLLTIVVFDDGKHIVANRDGTFTGSPDASLHTIMTYPIKTVDSGVMERTLSEEDVKSKQYVPPEIFAANLPR